MKNYTVGFVVTGSYYAVVRADSVEEAVRKAEKEFEEADFAELEGVDGDAYTVDVDGDREYL